MFENLKNFFKKSIKKEDKSSSSKDAAKERLHLVLMQDRANVSADFLELMKQEIIEVIKKYIEVDEKEIDVRLTNKENDDGTNGAPALYANIPILNIKNDMIKIDPSEPIESKKEFRKETKKEEKKAKADKINEEKIKEEKAEVAEIAMEAAEVIIDDSEVLEEVSIDKKDENLEIEKIVEDIEEVSEEDVEEIEDLEEKKEKSEKK